MRITESAELREIQNDLIVRLPAIHSAQSERRRYSDIKRRVSRQERRRIQRLSTLESFLHRDAMANRTAPSKLALDGSGTGKGPKAVKPV